MTRRVALLVIVVALVIGVARIAQSVASYPAVDRVYSVDEVQSGLAARPGAWLGRTIRMRGQIATAICLDSCQTTMAYLMISFSTAPHSNDLVFHQLVLDPGPPDPVRRWLRRLPWLRSFVPPPQQPTWHRAAIYRVRLGPSAFPCARPPCFEAVLLDADPQPTS